MFLVRVISRFPLGQWFRQANSGFTVLNKDGTSYKTTRSVLDKDGASYSVPSAVLDNNGTSYTVV